MTTRFAALATTLCAFVAGCTGSVVDGNPGASGSGPGPSNAAGASGSAGSGSSAGGGSTAPGTFVPAKSRLRRLTSYEYKNSILELLGASTQFTTELEADTAYNGLTSLAAASVTLSQVDTEKFNAAAHSLAEGLVRDTARREAVVGCAPSGPADEACLTSFVTSFGRRAFRRPLTPEELTTYTGLGKTAMQALGDFWGGVQYALAAFLQSPNFLYRAELGTPDSTTPRQRALDGYELATRLSYLLVASTPDRALLDAAASGALASTEGLRREAERLLGDPRAEDAVLRVFGERFRLGALDTLPQSTEVFPLLTDTLGPAMRSETLSVFKDVIFTRDADFRQVFTTTDTFVNTELARLYGVSAPAASGFAKVSLPATGPRGGLLTQASFLALNAHETQTSPTYRGKFIIESILCRQVPSAPNDVNTEFDTASLALTARQRLAEHQVRDDCVACHSVMDPPGLALEHFDAIGAYRETDRGMAIDATGALDGVAFNGARELGQVIANNADSAKCVVRNLYRVATAQMENPDPADPVIGGLSRAFEQDGFRVRSALLKLVEDQGFRFVADPE